MLHYGFKLYDDDIHARHPCFLRLIDLIDYAETKSLWSRSGVFANERMKQVTERLQTILETNDSLLSTDTGSKIDEQPLLTIYDATTQREVKMRVVGLYHMLKGFGGKLLSIEDKKTRLQAIQEELGPDGTVLKNTPNGPKASTLMIILQALIDRFTKW